MGFSIFKKKGDEIDEVEAAAAEQQIDTLILSRTVDKFLTRE